MKEQIIAITCLQQTRPQFIIMNNEQLRITNYNIPLFLNCYKAYPPTHTNCSSYLILQYENDESQFQISNLIQSKFICPVINNEDKQITLILMQGQCFHKFILSRRNTLNDPILSEQQIWILIATLSSAFMFLSQNGLSHHLTHLRQYCVRKIGIVPKYKLIFHSSMISQLKAAQQGLCRWDDLYLSPEELKQNFVPEKSIVFSMGVMLLNICSNCDRDRSIYKLNNYEVDHQRIKYKLTLVHNKYGYSKVLCNFIQKCLKINYQQRFDFSGLWNCLNEIIKRKNIKCWSIINEFLQKKNKQNSDTEHKKPDLEINKRFNLYKMIKKTKEKKEEMTKIPQSQKKFQVASLSEEQQQFNKKIMRLGNQYNNSFQESTQKQENQFLEGQKYEEDVYLSDQEEPLPRKQQVKMISDYRGTFGGNRHHEIQSEQSQQPKKNIEKIQKIQKIQKIMNVKINDPVHKKTLSFEHDGLEGANLVSDYLGHKNKQEQLLDFKIIKNNLFQKIGMKNNKKQLDSPQKAQQKQMTKVRHQYSIPQLIKSLNFIKLQNCLKPVEQLIKNFTSIGIWIEGDVYYGDYSKGTKNGLSLQVYTNGEYYYGFFKKDLYHGEGFYFWNQSQYYLGHFNSGHKVWGRLQGEIRYQGSFKGNKRHGQGTCWYSTGEVYSGNWENGKRDGKGFIIQPSGTIFSGHWVRGNRRGEGYLEMDKIRIGGFWNGETVEGECLIQYENGDLFRGEIGSELQKLNGQYFSKSGTIFKGDFENDQPSEGLLQYSNGDKYYGQLRKMKRHGYGEYYYGNGQVYKGNWQNNQKVTDYF